MSLERENKSNDILDDLARRNRNLDKLEQDFGYLEENLTAQLAQNMKLHQQGASLVDKLLGLVKVRGMYAKKDTVNNGIDVGVCLENAENTVVKYQFRYNSDGLLLLRGVKTGTQVAATPPVITTTGAYNVNSLPNMYTTVIGDSFSFEFTGNTLIFRRLVESRGGLWEFVLNNGQKANVSCYNPTTSIKQEVTVFSGLPYATYTCTATFKGDDPLNPPSSSPSRGYLHHNPNDPTNPTEYTVKSMSKSIEVLDESTAKNLIPEATIPDFAISARPNGKTYASEWVPQHGSVSGVSRIPNIKVIIDGVDVVSMPSTLPTKDLYYDIESIDIFQTFRAVNPNGTDGDMWEHFLSHTIRKDRPFLEIKNRLKMLQDTDIGDMYLTMLAASKPNVSRLVLNNGVEYDSIANDGTEVELDKDVSSAMYAGEYAVGRYHACAVDVGSYAEATGMRQNNNGRVGLLMFRTDNVAKFYLKTFGGVAKTGEVFQNMQRIACVTGVKYPNTLLKTI